MANGYSIFFLTQALGPTVGIVIPPPANAVFGLTDQRERHIHSIAQYGRMGCQKQSGCNQRSKIEAQLRHWQQMIGTKRHSRKFETQKTEICRQTDPCNTVTQAPPGPHCDKGPPIGVVCDPQGPTALKANFAAQAIPGP